MKIARSRQTADSVRWIPPKYVCDTSARQLNIHLQFHLYWTGSHLMEMILTWARKKHFFQHLAGVEQRTRQGTYGIYMDKEKKHKTLFQQLAGVGQSTCQGTYAIWR